MPDEGDLAAMRDPAAKELLQSTIPARLAYNWSDGTSRVVPIWFYWTGEEILLGSPLGAPKIRVLEQNSKIALTIDDEKYPYKVLTIRGTATVDTVDSVFPEYAAIARRYLGEEGGEGFLEQFRATFPQMARIAIRPEVARIVDLSRPSHFPSAWRL